MKVCKFGGSSLADAGQLGKVCDIVAADSERRLVVVSAPGKRHKEDTKVTDLLIACAESKLAGCTAEEEKQAVLERFVSVQKDLGMDDAIISEIADDLARRLAGDRSDKGRFEDTLKAAGEDNCAKLVAAEFNRRGVRASYIDPRDAGMLLSNEHGNAQVLPEAYERLASLRDISGVGVFPGFFGFTREGSVVTFPRGGSDITGSILAAAVKAEVYENFTDVDSVFAADPGIVSDVAPIRELTFREMRELSYAGFNVLHDEAIMPAVSAGVPICIKNTNCPEAAGTRIVPVRGPEEAMVVGIASSEGFCTISVGKYLMNREIGFGRRLLQILEEEGLSYEHAPSGIDNMSVILREKGFDEATEAHVLKRIKSELEATNLDVERGLALVMIVGEGMRYHVGVAAKAAKALADADVNLEMINQGSSEISIMFGVKAVCRKNAVRALYDAFLRSREAGS